LVQYLRDPPGRRFTRFDCLACHFARLSRSPLTLQLDSA
jgi:hypothetical protein